MGPDVDFTARELELLSAELERSAAPELLARQQLRKEKIQDTTDANELLRRDGELPACRECGAIPYLSFVRCSCRYAPAVNPSVSMPRTLNRVNFCSRLPSPRAQLPYMRHVCGMSIKHACGRWGTD